MSKFINGAAKLRLALFVGIMFLSSFSFFKDKKPTFFIIGDSTVKNGQGKGGGGLWGWGDFIAPYMDTARIRIENRALGGTSSRTFQAKLWDGILRKVEKGDFVIMQFGHNDGSPLADTARARGTIPGTGDDSKEIFNPITKQNEVVHTYGWYMRKFVDDVSAKDGIPIICSPIPRNDWKEGKVTRSTNGYAKWAAEVAKSEGAYFIDLNNLVASKYEELGADKVKPFFPGDHTHTNIDGAKINAEIVVQQLKMNGPKELKKYFK